MYVIMDLERCVEGREGVDRCSSVDMSAGFASVLAGSGAALRWCVLVCGELASDDEEKLCSSKVGPIKDLTYLVFLMCAIRRS